MQTFRRGTGSQGVWGKLFLCIALWSGVCAGAQADSFEEYEIAYMEFSQLAESLAQGQRMPQLADKNAARLLAVLSNSSYFLDAKTHATRELPALSEMCQQTSMLITLYTVVNLNPTVLNMKAYPRELELLQTFQLDCIAKLASLTGELLGTFKPEDLPSVRRDGAQQMRNGAFHVYYGYLKAVNAAEVDESQAAHIMAALARNAVQFASVMQPAQRKQLIVFMESGGIKESAVLRPHLGKIMAAMATSECTGICGL